MDIGKKTAFLLRHCMLFTTVFFAVLAALEAQNKAKGSPTVTNFSRSDYQAGTQNWAIFQDESGIMYFGNNKGLLEFDGTNWQTFSLPNRTILRSMALDPEGKLFLGGQNELGYLQTNQHGRTSFTSLTHLIPEAQKSFEDVWKIFIRSDSIFFCSEKGIFHYQGDKVKVIAPVGERFENFFEFNGKIYVQEKRKGLYLLENGQLRLVSDENLFLENRITTFLPYQNNQTLIVTFSHGLFLMDESGIRAWEAKSADLFKTYQAYCALVLSDGRFAIGTAQNGLLIIDQKGNQSLHLNKQNGLQNNTILSVYQDLQNNLWLGLDNGIDYAEIDSPFSLIRSQAGIEGTGYASIIHQDMLYLGTNQGLFYMDWNRAGNLALSKKFKPVQNAIGQVWNINRLSKSIVVAQHKGASYLDKNQVLPFSTEQGSWKFMELEAHPGYALEGTYTGLVIYRDMSNQQEGRSEWQLHRKLEGFDESARVFEEDDDGNIWVSHAYRGLYRIRLSQDLNSIEDIKFYNSSQGLPIELFINVARIRKELVFTTPKGVYKYNKDQDRFEEHQEFTELLGGGRDVHRLLEDELGNIWFSIDSEFGVLEVKEKGFFNKVDLSYFNQIHDELVDGFEHVYAYDEGNIFIGTEKGFIHYNPLQTKDTQFPFDILIRKVTSITAADSVVYQGKNSYRADKKPQGFNFKMNDLRFSYSIPYFEKIDHVQYRFMLEGFEDAWSAWTFKTEKEYTNLASGDYHFRVKARNAYGQVSSEAVYEFTIFPPWYFSWYAQVAYFILGIVMITGLIKVVTKREQKKTAAFKLEQTQKLKKKEAEVKKSEGEIIKLRNEKLQADIKNKTSQLASATMHLVQKNEILLKLRNELKLLGKEASPGLKRKIDQMSRTIGADIQQDDNWEQFELYFDQVHQNFFKRLRQKFPELTPKDQKLCAYLRMNLTTKEIAPLLNISVRGVEISRYRLRKKLKLDSDTNLVTFIFNV